jgi:hypothetical protein
VKYTTTRAAVATGRSRSCLARSNMSSPRRRLLRRPVLADAEPTIVDTEGNDI